MSTIAVMAAAGGREDRIVEPGSEVDGDGLDFSGGAIRVGHQAEEDEGHQEAVAVEDAKAALEARLLAAETAKRVAEVSRAVVEGEVLHLKRNVHDANNFLSGAMGMLELALMSVLDPKVRQDLEASYKNLQMVTKMVNRAMESNGELKLNKEPVELNSLIDAVVISAKPFLKGPVRVNFMQTDQLVVNADILNLHSVLLNLVKNAAEALEDNSKINSDPTIKIYFSFEGENVVISVLDNGPGIPANLRKKIFEESGVSTKGKRGHGLGLPMVRKIVEAHGGTISLESTTADEGEHTGTSFCITLPSSI